MKKIFIIVVLLAMMSCKENERLTYEGDSYICFDVSRTKMDTLAFPLLTNEDGHEYNVPVMVIGNILVTERKYKVEVVQEETTATEGVHYRIPVESTFPVGVFKSGYMIQLYKSDSELSETIKYLTLRLVPTSGFEVAFDNRSTVVLSLTTMLRVPSGTDYYGDMTFFENMFGRYSKKKHEIIIELTGHDFWDGNYGAAGGQDGLYYEEEYYKPYARALLKYITDQDVYDENGNLIKPWES